MTATAPTKRLTSRGGHAIRWIETFCRHTSGRWYGQQVTLEPWQKRFIIRLLELDSVTGRRKIRRAYLRVPKKNTKTELAAFLGCYFAAADSEPAPEVYCAANSDEQADLVFHASKTCCELSPELSQISERYAKEILFRRNVPGITENDGTVGKLHRLSAVVGANDGLKVSHAIFDEVHEFTKTKGEAMHNVITNGMAARLDPLELNISTAGYDVESLEYRLYEYGKAVEAGLIDDPTFLFLNYEAPAGMDYRDMETWRLANPMWGITIDEAYARQQIGSKSEGIVRRYNLNQQTETETIWLPAGAWDACETSGMELDPDEPIVLGWDAARNRDSTAVVTGQRIGGRVRLSARIWERPINPANGQLVEGWVTPTAEVTNHIRERASDYTVREVGYDPWGIKESVQQLETEGLTMTEVPQTNARMIPATEYLYELICDGVIEHDGSADFARQMRNVVARQVPNGVRMDKGRARRAMDAGVAAAIVAYLLQAEPEEDKSEPQILVYW